MKKKTSMKSIRDKTEEFLEHSTVKTWSIWITKESKNLVWLRMCVGIGKSSLKLVVHVIDTRLLNVYSFSWLYSSHIIEKAPRNKKEERCRIKDKSVRLFVKFQVHYEEGHLFIETRVGVWIQSFDVLE